MSNTEALSCQAEIEIQGTKIRELKAAKAPKEDIKKEVDVLISLKGKYKELTGKDFVPATTCAPTSSKDKKKSDKTLEVKKSASLVQTEPTTNNEDNTVTLYCGGDFNAKDITTDKIKPSVRAALKCLLVANALKVSSLLIKGIAPDTVACTIQCYPAIVDKRNVAPVIIFGANAICRYLQAMSATASNSSGAAVVPQSVDLTIENALDTEEFSIAPTLASLTENNERLMAALNALENISATIESSQLLSRALYLSVNEAIPTVQPGSFTKLSAICERVGGTGELQSAKLKLSETLKTAGDKSKLSKADRKAAKASSNNNNMASTEAFDNSDVVKVTLNDVSWATAGLASSLKIIFDAAILAAFPQAKALGLENSVIIRCGNASFGDFQCNNAMALSKGLKPLAATEGYKGPVAPKDVADRIICGIPSNPLIKSATSAPNGFINIKLSTENIVSTISDILAKGVKPPVVPKLKILVDFSSPNIAKEMHVGHLRSTIIGDAVCRILEFCEHEVMRVNHVGDWGTQFGMLITYLQEEFPDILTSPPNISDLTAIYKKSKARFDADETFKEQSRQNVVKLQSGDSACRAIWQLLCNISRQEFQKVYDALDVTVTEVGESFYNPMIPGAIEALQSCGLVTSDDGMLVIWLPHFTIPLIVRKSDGGYGYDSTDMAALQYRTHTLNREWLIYITDAGQAPHFHMCFDAARAAGWLPTKTHRVDHIGFGVVCGDDGKRFKTRSSETVRLIDLLDAAKDKMRESLQKRAEEGKSPLQGPELDEAAKIIGYGAVKYFDLKQHPSTNYIFSYERMLDTKGDTAVYLLFAYARLASILRKAKEERSISASDLRAEAANVLTIEHAAERALAFELLQFGDVLKNVVSELLPNRLCEYLKELAVKFTDFVTKCHVLNAKEEALVHSRILLCDATQSVMKKCFELLGISTLERI